MCDYMKFQLMSSDLMVASCSDHNIYFEANMLINSLIESGRLDDLGLVVVDEVR